MPSPEAPFPASTFRPRRSVLYLPGANERALAKAAQIPADALILDLEDAVAPDAKPAARERVREAVRSGQYGDRELAIRVNARSTEWHDDDLRAVAEAGPAAVVIPKVNTPDDVHAVDQALTAAGAPGHTAIWAMLETPAAILAATQIAAATPRLTVLVMGTNDLAMELHAEQVPGRAPLLTALSLALLAARAAGKTILDGVYNSVPDLAGFRAECVQGRQLGFDGKTLIHPSQVDPCNQLYAPTPAQLDEAQAIITAYQTALAAGRAVTVVNGRLIENLHVVTARRTLASAPRPAPPVSFPERL